MTRRRAVTAAVVLWLVFAFFVWNVIFDRLIVLAGRRYSHDAAVQFATSGTYLRVDEVMRPAAAHAVWTASMVAAAIAVIGLALIRVAVVRQRGRT